MGAFFFQLQSFYVAIFRYICLFHDDFLFKWNLNPHSLARLIICLQFASSCLPIYFLFNLDSIPGLQVCLGKGYLNFISVKYNVCQGSKICIFTALLLMLFMSNILDLICLLCCFHRIKTNTEKSKSMIGEKDYIKRKMDNGISLKISFYQFCVEVGTFLVLILLHSLHLEQDWLMSRLIAQFSVFVIFVVLPCFYLNGDVGFRNRVSKYGIIKALKFELLR